MKKTNLLHLESGIAVALALLLLFAPAMAQTQPDYSAYGCTISGLLFFIYSILLSYPELNIPG